MPAHVERLVSRLGLTVDGRASERLLPGRNLSLVCRRGHERFLVKAAAAHASEGVDFEGGLLAQLEALLGPGAPAPRIPAPWAVAPGVIVLRWLPGTVLVHSRSAGAVERRVGQALAVVHARTRGVKPALMRRVQGTLARELVWTTPAVFATFGPATATWWRRVQDDAAAMEALARLCLAETREPQVLVHGDARRANVLAGAPVGLVDWEQAGLGDGARDLGLFGADDVAAHLEGGLSLAAVRARLHGLLAGYRDESARQGHALGPRFLERVVAWTGEGLLRRVWTRSVLEQRFSEKEVLLVESACDALRNPEAWTRQFWRRR